MKINFDELKNIFKLISVVCRGDEGPVIHFINKDKKLVVEYSGNNGYYFNELKYSGSILSFSLDYVKLLKTSKGLSGDYELSIKDDVLIMKGTGSRYSIGCFNIGNNSTIEYDRYFEALKNTKVISLQAERLVNKITNISYCIADPKDSQTMACVYIKENSLIAASQFVGGFSRYDNIQELDGNIINNTVLNMISFTNSDFLDIGYLENAIIINGDNFGILSSVDNDYPINMVSAAVRKGNYDEKNTLFSVVIPPSMSKAVLKKFLNFVDDNSVSISIQDKFVIFSCYNDGIHAEEKVPADIIKPFQGNVLVNPKIMYQALNSMSDDCYLFGYDDNCLYLSDGSTSIFFNRDVNDKGTN